MLHSPGRAATRVTTVVAALLLAVSMLVAPALTAPDLHAATAAAPQAPGKWKCGKWRNHGGIGWRHCAKFKVFEQKFDVDFTRTFHNKFYRKRVAFQCHTEKQTTWRFYAEGTVKAEAGVIFAKAEASATAGVERSATTVDAASATIKVGPRKWAHCKRGMYKYKFRGWVKKQTCDSSGCVWGTWKSFTGQAPSREAFMVGPGRG